VKQDIIEAMNTNETSFFRDVTPFERFKELALPEVIERRKTRKSLRVLCAATSTGQEPYSLAMTIVEMGVRLADWKIESLGVNIDTKVIKKAEEAIYSQFEVQWGLPVQMLVKYFERADQSWKLKAQIRDRVKFRRCNLLEPMADLGKFDVIFCRNVLIYFDTPTKRDMLEKLAVQIAEDGYLFLGGTETVLDISDRFAACPGQRGIYLPQAKTKPLRAAG
jgi:chemotaxis protein methyltransferase CheR